MVLSSSIESFVPDSTAGTSPAIVKRPARTYGRKKSPALADDAPMLQDSASSEPSSSRLRTAPRTAHETVDPSSDNDEEESDGEKASTKFQFGWKERLMALDNSDSEDEKGNNMKTTAKGLISTDRPVAIDDIFNSSSPGPADFGEPEGLFLQLEEGDSDHENDAPRTSPAATTPDAGQSSTPGGQSTPATTDPEAPGSRSSKRESKQRSLEEVRLSIVPVTSPSPSPPTRKGRGESKRKSTTKRPTKRDREETLKESARLTNERDVSIKSNSKQLFSLHNLLGSFTGVSQTSVAPKALVREPSAQSDPIQSFSSPELTGRIAPDIPDVGPSTSLDRVMRALESSDEDPPDNIIEEPKGKKAMSLKERKEQYLKTQAAKRQVPAKDEDSDLEITTSKPAPIRSTERRVSHVRKEQLRLAGVNPASRPKPGASLKGKGREMLVNRSDMDKMMWGRVLQEKRAEDAKSRGEWVKHGGNLREEDMASKADPAAALKAYAQEGLKALEGDKGDSQSTLVNEDDDSDDDWKPEGSMSPARHSGNEGEDEEDVTMAAKDDGDEDSDDQGNEQVLKTIRSKRPAILDSDEEDEENQAPNPARRTVRRPLTVSDSMVEGDTEPETSTPFSEDGATDKENNASLVYDRGGDKENNRVPRLRPHGSASSFESLEASTSTSSQPRNPLQAIERSPSTPKARGLGRTNLTQLFEAQLSEPRRTPELQASPFLRERKDSGGFSQFSQEEGTLLNHSSPGAGLADLFGTHTQAPSESPKTSLLGAAFGEKLRGLPRAESLSLTQDVLRPAFQAEEQLLLKANKIVEKEQELVLDVAFEPEPEPSQPKLYVNDEGFLTQTRPQSSRASQSETQRSLLGTPSDLRPSGTQRSPLVTLSFSDPSQSSPGGHEPLRRLRKRSQSPSERAAEVTTKKRRNAFDVLGQGAHDEAERKRRRLEKSEFVEEEAHESDDEGGFWGRGKKMDDDEDMGDEDLDKPLEGLVDDQEMDDETLAQQMVQEKFNEQQQQLDERAEQKANDIVQGEWRKKHKGGEFLSDESDDEMDDDAKKARRKLRKERKRREDVEAMGANPETKAFAATYQSTVEEDDNEFAHLAQDETERVLSNLDGLGHEDEEDEDEDDEMNPEAESINAADLRELIRERARQPREEEERVDYNDIAWLDGEPDEDAEMTIKTVKPSVKKQTRTHRQGLDPSDMDDGLESQEPSFRPATQQLERSRTWAKREERNRNGTTARNTGKMAVTAAKSGKGSVRRGPQFKSELVAEASKPAVRKAPSMLVDVDRKARFS